MMSSSWQQPNVSKFPVVGRASTPRPNPPYRQPRHIPRLPPAKPTLSATSPHFPRTTTRKCQESLVDQSANPASRKPQWSRYQITQVFTSSSPPPPPTPRPRVL